MLGYGGLGLRVYIKKKKKIIKKMLTQQILSETHLV